MENTPTAPAEATQAPESVATPNTNTNAEPVQAPDMHGFTSEDLAGMRTFIDNNGGWDKIKSRISNPEPAQPAPAPAPQAPAQPQPQPQPQQQYQPPEGSISAQEFLAERYFKALSERPEYEAISEQIASGDVLKEMAAFNITALNRDGSINDGMIRRYLDLKAQTVPAKPTAAEPNASSAPTVTYTEAGDTITDINKAYKILMEPGNPDMAKAEEFLRNHYNPNAGQAKA